MKEDTIKRFSQEVMQNLQENILPYWMEKMVDPRGGFYGRRDGYDKLDENAPKGAILNGRTLWSFSAAYRVTGKKEYLDIATRARDYIMEYFYDSEFGGVYWSLNADGTPLDTKKQFYAIGFTIYGLSEYARATGDRKALELAIKLYHDIESHSYDSVNGGYLEACTRDWQKIDDMRLSDKDENMAKTMNTHLHILEPYTNLYRVWKNEELRQSIVRLLDIFLDKIEDPKSRHLGLFFDEEWNRHDRIISYGHDIEASWLLLEAAQVLGDEEILKKVLDHTKHIAEAALEGRCYDGSMVYERHASGSYDNDKHWWVQAENVIGQVYLFKYHGMEEYLDKAVESWQYIKDNIVDYDGGEWFWSRQGDSVNRVDDKAGFWKCPYHNSRMCIEVAETLEK